MRSKYIDAFNLLKSYSHLGENLLSNGSHLIARAPHIAPEAWLHVIYRGLDEIEISELEKQLYRPIPIKYKSFLQVSNGLSVFNTTLNLFGYRNNYNRNTADVWQPFDLTTLNNESLPENMPDDFFIIGSYNWDGSILCIDSTNSKIHLSERDSFESKYEWSSFEEMLLSEIKRLMLYHNTKGIPYDEEISTLPIPD